MGKLGGRSQLQHTLSPLLQTNSLTKEVGKIIFGSIADDQQTASAVLKKNVVSMVKDLL